MTDEKRLRQLFRGLEEAVAGTAADPGIAPSLRRMARAILETDDISAATRALAETVATSDETDVLPDAQTLVEALRGELDRWSQPQRVQNVLLVESDPAVATAVRDELARLDFEVTWVPGGEGVLDILKRRSFDLLVVDILLNDKDGRDLILEVSLAPETADLFIVALSPALDRISLARSECLALGADAFLTRESAPKEIGREVATLLSRGDPVSHELETSGLFRRARFFDRFVARDRSGHGGSVALVAFDNYREAVDRFGTEQADAGLAVLADRIRELHPGVEAIGRWATRQIVLLIPGQLETEASQVLRDVLGQLANDAVPDEPAGLLAASMSAAVVLAPTGSELDDRMLVAGRVRLGLATEGTRILTEGAPDDTPQSILVVEDDPLAMALVKHRLEHVGLQVVAFMDGDEASAALNGLDYSLAILDINLPGKDGLQLVREIREGGTGHHRPIIILSGMGSDADIVRGLEAGADDYMLKPFSPIELTARVRRLLEATRTPGT